MHIFPKYTRNHAITSYYIPILTEEKETINNLLTKTFYNKRSNICFSCLLCQVTQKRFTSVI